MDVPTPSKIFAVHLNYRTRASQRGRVPAEPSYFLKPPSSITGDGQLVRPQGAELLTCEGEIAVIIGKQAKHVSPAEAHEYIGWYAPANDAGVHDFRWADRGSNLMSKGQDGFTPMGRPIPASQVDAQELQLRTLVNGEVVQEDGVAGLIFTFGALVADLSRMFTLEPGDVILSGTPAGGSTLEPGDVVEVELVGHGRVRSEVIEAAAPLQRYGAMPRATPEARAYAHGGNSPRPVSLSPKAQDRLQQVSTATITAQLLRRGIQGTFLTGLKATRPDLRMFGYARTLRYGALREDIRDSSRSGVDAQKRAIETTSPEDVLVIEARGERGAGTIGDILAARAIARGASGIVTDGGARDTPGLVGLPIPTYYQVPNAASLWAKHVPLETDVTVTCAGVLVVPGDVIVGDAEGVVVIPAALAEEVADDSFEQERREAFALEQVQKGEALRGLYPLTDERRAEFEHWRSTHDD